MGKLDGFGLVHNIGGGTFQKILDIVKGFPGHGNAGIYGGSSDVGSEDNIIQQVKGFCNMGLIFEYI